MLKISNRARFAAVLLGGTLALSALSGCVAVVAGGVVAGALAADDRRSIGTQADDKGIVARGETRVREAFPKAHINVNAFNRKALLTGEVADVETKIAVERIMKAVPNVRAVYSEITVGSVASISARTKDGYITSKIKANMVDARKFSANHVKVITEAKVVYLMGIVTHQEADDAVAIARSTDSDVKKVVVGFFEYLD